MAQVSFDELKALVSITDVAAWLNIKVRQTGDTFRGDCILCGAERSFTLTPKKGLFGCFKCQVRGSHIDLVHHVRQTANIREAAMLIQEHFLGSENSSSTVPPHGGTVPTPQKRPNDGVPEGTVPKEQKAGTNPPTSELASKLAKVRERLLYEHEAIQAIGLTPEVARAFDIGYCPSGIMRGRIVSPMYLNGVHVAYKGLATTAEQAPLMLFPSNLAELAAAPPQEAPQAVDDVRQFLRVVK